MRVLLRNPRREMDLPGPVTVHALMERLGLNREAHRVLRNGELVPGDAMLADDDQVEVRQVVSGGAT